MELTGKSVHVAMCCYRNEMKAQTCMGLLSILQGCLQANVSVENFIFSDSPYIGLGKSVLIGNFMKNSDAEYLLMVDSDMGFDFDNLRKLMEADVDVVAGVYPPRVFPIRNLTRPETGNGLTRCSHVPGGFLLMKRSAIERLEASFVAAGRQMVNLIHGMTYFQFCSMSVDPQTSMVLGEDYTFCNYLREAEVNIYCDFDVRLSHVGDHCFSLDRPTMAMSRIFEQGLEQRALGA